MQKRILVGVLTAVLACSGCSLKKGETSRFSIALAPAGTPHRASSATHALSQGFTTMAQTGPNSLGELNCFAINVRGGDVPTTRVCETFDMGVLDGARAIDAAFTPQVPVSDGLVFEALGYSSATCGDLASDVMKGGASPTVFRVGSVTVDAATLAKSGVVTIPVSFSVANSFSCKNAPYTIFAEPFTYTTSPLSAASGNLWVSGGTEFTVNTGSGNLTVPTLSPVENTDLAAIFIDVTKPYLEIGATVNITAGAGAVDVNLGFADAASTTANSIQCEAHFSGGAVTLRAGTGTGLQTTANAGTPTVIATGPALFYCSLYRQPNGSYDVLGDVIDSSFVVASAARTAAPISNPCVAATCDWPFIDTKTTTGISSGTIDDFYIDQADVPQPF